MGATRRRTRRWLEGRDMKDVHMIVGILSITLNAGVAVIGAWEWWRARSDRWFWLLLRAGQLIVVLQAVLGGVLLALGHKAPDLHYLYGALPLLVSVIAEQLRAASAQMVLDSRGFQSAQAVGKLPEDEQHAMVRTIVQREVGVMTLAALVVSILLLRAAQTAP